MGTKYSQHGNKVFPTWEQTIPNVGTNHGDKLRNHEIRCHQDPVLEEKIEFCVFAQDLTVSRKKVPVYRCFTHF